MIIFTDYFIPENFAGITLGPVALIRPKYEHDVGLIEHEKIHIKQFWRTFGLMPLLYLISPKHRLQYEVEAYKEQLVYSPWNLDLFASFISSKYKLDITKEEARKLLIS